MRLITFADFQSTGWDVSNANVRAQVDGILACQQQVFDRHGITRDVHVACLLGQISHECGEGHEMTESLNYKPAALLAQWPGHFRPDQAQRYGRTAEHPADQRMIGILAYGGRMGNAPAPSEDGYAYRGRGLIQTTGKSGYRELGTVTGLPLLQRPETLVDPAHAFECAVAEFVQYPNMLTYCETGDLLAIGSLINRGHVVHDPSKIIGQADRAAQTLLWKHQLGIA